MATFGTFTAGQVLTAAELNTAGAWSDYTPTWTQSATITKTVNWARYTQLGKWVQGSIKMTATGAGTANNKIIVGLPVTASSNNFIIGQMVYMDESLSPDAFIRGGPSFALLETTTSASFVFSTTSGVDITLRYGQTGMPTGGDLTVASGDIIYVQFAYEAA